VTRRVEERQHFRGSGGGGAGDESPIRPRGDAEYYHILCDDCDGVSIGGGASGCNICMARHKAATRTGDRTALAQNQTKPKPSRKVQVAFNFSLLFVCFYSVLISHTLKGQKCCVI
jgi:hypothetical protein